MAKSTKKTAMILMIIILISKVTGFFRDIVLAQSFGIGNVTDAYITALNIPVVLFNGISTSLATTFIPMFYKVKEKGGREEVDRFTSNVINIVTIVSILLIIIGLIFTPYIVKIFAVGFEGEVFELTVEYSRILIFSMIFIAINGIISSYLVASGKTYIHGLITIPFNLLVILAIIMGYFTNSYIMVVGTLIAYVGQLLFILPFMLKSGYKYSLKVNLKDENIKSILYLVVPVFFGSYVGQINAVVNKTLASTLESGTLTALNYANKLNIFAVGIIAVTLSTVMYPILSRLANENKMKQFKYNLSKSMNIIILVMTPITVIMMIFSTEIIMILFEGGSFDLRATYLTSTALFYYSIGIVASGLRDILSKGFYSLQDTKTPVRNATVSVIINVMLSIILVQTMGIGGLALASSISAIVTTILMIYSLRKKIGKLGFKHILRAFIKVLISAIIMGIIMSTTYGIYLIDGSKISIAINTGVSILLGSIVYTILVLILNVKEAREIWNMGINKIKNIIKI